MTADQIIAECKARISTGEPITALYQQLAQMWPDWRCSEAAFAHKLRVAGIEPVSGADHVLVPALPQAMRPGAVYLAMTAGATATVATIIYGDAPEKAKLYRQLFSIERIHPTNPTLQSHAKPRTEPV